jgi:3-dehydroquinate dehydratase-2
VKTKILIINGPNLNLLGSREPSVYGTTTFEEHLAKLKNTFSEVELEYFQSNIEGEIIDKLHAGREYKGIILNAGAYTHTSIAIGDAVSAIATPVIEVHISNVMNREDDRHISKISRYCEGIITGFGLYSYNLALKYFLSVKG